MTDQDALATLIAKDEIRDLVLLCSRGHDRRDTPLVKNLYTKDGLANYGDIFMGRADDFLVALDEMLLDVAYTGHFICNHLISVDGDRAEGEVYLLAYSITKAGEGAAIAVRYFDKYVRQDGQWRIDVRDVAFDWQQALSMSGPAATAAPEDDISYDSLSSAVFARSDGPATGSAIQQEALMTGQDALATLVAKDEIRELNQLYSRAIDRRDMALVRSLYTKDGKGIYEPFFRGTADEFIVALEEDLPGMHYTGHFICNQLISVDGDTAEGEVYTLAYHILPTDGGETVLDLRAVRYVDSYRKENGRWCYAVRRLAFEWTTVDPLPLPEEGLPEPANDQSYAVLASRMFAHSAPASPRP